MTSLRTARAHRLLAAAVASLLFVASVLAIGRAREAGLPTDDRVAPAGVAPEASPSPGSSPGTEPEPEAASTGALADTDTAAAIGADRLMQSALSVAQGPWRDLGDPAWPTRDERPVYVVEAELGPAGDRLAADVVVATRLDAPSDTLVLRFLPAARALGDRTGLEVSATVDGAPVAAEVDRDGARLLLPLGRERAAGEALLARIQLSYTVVPVSDIIDDGGPAAFGLLAAHPEATTLGHWLPLLTIPTDQGAMVSWGDVGAFPTAVWSVRTVHDGTLVSGGRDTACDDDEGDRSCTWSRGIALRDVSAVLLPSRPVVAEAELGGVRHRALAATGNRADAEAVLAEAVASAEAFGRRFGPLAWDELDTVAVPLGRGAAGMEFPGLSLIDDEHWDDVDGGFGTAVIVHEVAHQWFHALVGNGSLSNPVVDESIAQYLSFLYWRDAFGEEAARRFARTTFAERYAGARERGTATEPPAQPLTEFDGADAYGPLVYAQAPLGWIAAEEAVGIAAVEAFLAQVVRRYGLGFVSDRQLVDDAVAFDAALGEALARYWFEAAPAP